MSTAIATREIESTGRARPDPRRWRALAVLGLIQFMLVVDVSIVNVALPRIQHDLHFSHAGLAATAPTASSPAAVRRAAVTEHDRQN